MGEPSDQDLEIARLKGKIEAYQAQLQSAAIELLRKQVKDLQDADSARRQAKIRFQSELAKLQEEFEKFKSEITERLDKASELYKDLREQLRDAESRINEKDDAESPPNT